VGLSRPQSFAMPCQTRGGLSAVAGALLWAAACCGACSMPCLCVALRVAGAARAVNRTPWVPGRAEASPTLSSAASQPTCWRDRRRGAASPHALSWPQRQHQCNNTSAAAPLPATVQGPLHERPQRHLACVMERPGQSMGHVSPCTAATWPQQRVSLWCMLLHQPPLQPMPAVQCQMHAA
jgi:hypothetical protein